MHGNIKGYGKAEEGLTQADFTVLAGVQANFKQYTYTYTYIYLNTTYTYKYRGTYIYTYKQ